MQANFKKYNLNFKQASGTSRGILTEKETYILEISDGDKKGIGECAIFRGLSYDDVPEYEEKLNWLCEHINNDAEFLKSELKHFPSIIFGLEQALLNLKYGKDLYFPSDFTDGKDSIKINGLIWMGNADFMQKQIEEKLEKGFNCIKLKIGVDWESEKKVIQKLREKFPPEVIELRVDANGAFSFDEAKIVLQELAELKIHSIEQPIKKSEVRNLKSEDSMMAKLCAETPTPIALDEELIGVIDFEKNKIIGYEGRKIILLNLNHLQNLCA
jgi:o-succinylbenzoate synthase